MLLRAINFLKRMINKNKPKSYAIGRYKITLPPEHMLDVYQKQYKNYDKKLPFIAYLIEKKYKTMTIVDIGANIGDTAISLRNSCVSPIICIEGNQAYLPMLRKNLDDVSGVFCIVPKYIGLNSTPTVDNLITKNGTGRIDRSMENASDSQSIEADNYDQKTITTYKELISENKDLPAIRLVKIDTDGFDFKIIISSMDQLATDLPVLFFEFDPSFSPDTDPPEALKAVDALISIGYVHFVIYDNYGNYMMSFSEAVIDRFKDLFSFLEQTRLNGGGIPFLDVCCFSGLDAEIFVDLVNSERTNNC